MKKIYQRLLYLLLLFVTISSVKGQSTALKKAAPFYDFEALKSDHIVWKYLSVPENWENQNSSTINIAVAVLKNTAKIKNAPAVVFIQGGPGASGIETIWSWAAHPLRKTHDIVLFDVRGTGFSLPRLCPDLGKDLLAILAKNLSPQDEEKHKTNAALSCKQELIKKDIDIEAYNSMSIAKDLHALKEKLNYASWSVYGVSYGTYIAQVYADTFPKDLASLILDSPIDDISVYYAKNTSNYISSLNKVFATCNEDPSCKASYPDLEKTYYEVISTLKEKPITVAVSKNLVPSGTFTFNAEDFKIAMHQALYNKQLVEMIPALIYQFHSKNKEVLGNLVPAFSSLLQMDYGVYYCMSCNEALPANDFSDYQKDASQFKGLNGGISFYKSDFKVCEKWNLGRRESLRNTELSGALKKAAFPVLVLSGEYDPITPQKNGGAVARNFKTAYNIVGKTYGHVPGFTKIGNDLVSDFIANPYAKLDLRAFDKAVPMTIVNNLSPNAGVAKTGNSLSIGDPLFLSPLAIALGIMLIFTLVHLINFFKRKYLRFSDKTIRLLLVLTSAIGLYGLISLILSIQETANINYYIVAVGLPDKFDYIFNLLAVFLAMLSITILFFLLRIKKLTNRSILLSILFSNVLLAVYLFYWEII